MTKTKPKKTNHWVGRNKGHTIPRPILSARLPFNLKIHLAYEVYTCNGKFNHARVIKSWYDDLSSAIILSFHTWKELNSLITTGRIKHKYDIEGMMRYACNICCYRHDSVDMVLHIVKI